MRQASFKFRSRGGQRGRSGRRPSGPRARLRHAKRPPLKARFPVHVTWRMREGVWNLRTRRCFTALATAFWGGANRFGFRLVHYSVQGNHIHLLAEAADKRALARGMKGLGVRVARKLNRMMQRRGAVLADRYHARILKTPTEVKNAYRYLQTNAEHHYGMRYEQDPFTSSTPLIAPRIFFLRKWARGPS